MEIQNNFQNVSKLKEYVVKINSIYGTDAVKYNQPRDAYNLPSITGKIEGGEPGILNIMKNVFAGKNVSIEKSSGDIARRVSGKYDSFLVSLSQTEGFYFRSIIGVSGSLTDKDLTPNKLKLAGTTLTKNNFDDTIKKGLKANSNLPIDILNLARQLLETAGNPGTSIRTNDLIRKSLNAITSTDLKKFGKNYGEVLLAKWCLYNKPGAVSIFFPREENNPLADFIVNFDPRSGKPPLNVSAKFEGGANASLSSIIPAGTKPPAVASPMEKLAYDAIMQVAYGPSIKEGLLQAEKILNTVEYRAIKAMSGNSAVITLDIISRLVSKALENAGIKQNANSVTSEQYNKFKKEMSPFYSVINYKGFPEIGSVQKIAALPPKDKYHPVLYAFSASLADKFNSSSEFTEVLNKAATSIKAEQIYLDIGASAITVKVKEFQKSKFKFAPGALAYKSDNVRMKVAMIKT